MGIIFLSFSFFSFTFSFFPSLCLYFFFLFLYFFFLSFILPFLFLSFPLLFLVSSFTSLCFSFTFPLLPLAFPLLFLYFSPEGRSWEGINRDRATVANRPGQPWAGQPGSHGWPGNRGDGQDITVSRLTAHAQDITVSRLAGQPGPRPGHYGFTVDWATGATVSASRLTGWPGRTVRPSQCSSFRRACLHEVSGGSGREGFDAAGSAADLGEVLEGVEMLRWGRAGGRLLRPPVHWSGGASNDCRLRALLFMGFDAVYPGWPRLPGHDTVSRPPFWKHCYVKVLRVVLRFWIRLLFLLGCLDISFLGRASFMCRPSTYIRSLPKHVPASNFNCSAEPVIALRKTFTFRLSDKA